MFPSNFRFAADIVFFSNSTAEAEATIAELNEAGKTIGLLNNQKKIRFMKKVSGEGERVQLEGSQPTETSSNVYLERPMNIENDMKDELDKRRRSAWVALGLIKEATDHLTDPDL